MIIVPEIETVFILVPRTASGSIKRAMLTRYPKAFQIYRHMEADGIPDGYDRWNKVGIIRQPLERLWSLYKFLTTFDGPYEQAYIKSMRNSVKMSFSDWIINNREVFTNPYCSSGSLKFYPQYNVKHSLPENRKSQFLYLRPDLGTKIYRYTDLQSFFDDFDVYPDSVLNSSDKMLSPLINGEALEHMQMFFDWDYSWLEKSK